jgi:NAD(P)-dependent dehydrogenase (short-subunit alcohol dehydrogenase family)
MSRKVAFVTGASRGIGKASAVALAEVGYDVVVTARTVVEGEKYDYSPTFAHSGARAMPGSIEQTAEEVRRLGREALPIRLDLLDRSSVDAAPERTLREWGQIDVLLNNGIFQGPGLMEPFLSIPDDVVRRIFDGNVFAQIHITQRAIHHMLQSGRGMVINMTSSAALSDPPGPVGRGGWGFAYAASKGAFHRMVGILHAELGTRGIRAYNVNPGYVVTESMRALFGEKSDLEEAHRGAPPEVPAAVIAWLASDPEAAALAGKTINAQQLCKERKLLPGWPA